jgi:hypothetical protein
MAAEAEVESTGVRVAAVCLIVCLVAGPLSTHVYWLFGGTWGLYTNGVHDQSVSTGVRVLAAIVIALVLAAILVVLARVGFWQQHLVSGRVVRLLAWALATVFLLETLANFTWSRGDFAWWLYAPASLLIAGLALIVAGSGGSRPHVHRHRTLPSH